MGSFYSRCALSDLVITDNTPSRVVFLYECLSYNARSPSGACRPSNYWVPFTPGVPGKYNDYGRVLATDDQGPEARLAMFLVSHLVKLVPSNSTVLKAQEAVQSPRGDDPVPSLDWRGNPKLGYCHIREDIWQAVQKRSGEKALEHVQRAVDLRFELNTKKHKNLDAKARFLFDHETEFQRVLIDFEFYLGLEKLDRHLREDHRRSDESFDGMMREFVQEIAELRAVHLMMDALGRAWLPCQSHTQDMGLEESEWMGDLVRKTAAREQWRYEQGDGYYPEEMRDYLAGLSPKQRAKEEAQDYFPEMYRTMMAIIGDD